MIMRNNRLTTSKFENTVRTCCVYCIREIEKLKKAGCYEAYQYCRILVDSHFKIKALIGVRLQNELELQQKKLNYINVCPRQETN